MAMTVPEADLMSAADAVEEGELVIYPTETCYGLGCDALNQEALRTVYDTKQRPHDKGLTVVVADLAMAEDYCVLSDQERMICEAFMPGPLTLVAEKKEIVPDTLNTAFVFRVPGDEPARRLSRAVDGPVVATSANISGEGPYYRVIDIEERVRDSAVVTLDAGELPRQDPSTVVEVVEGEVVVRRAGPVKKEDVEAVIS